MRDRYRLNATVLGTLNGAQRSLKSNEQWCSDVIGNYGGANLLRMRHRITEGSVFNGTNAEGTWSNYPSDWHLAEHYNTPIIDPRDPFPILVSRLLAATNPSRITTNIPAALAELKDLPLMLRHAGRLLNGFDGHGYGLGVFQQAAAANLAFEFGWKPLLNDLLNLLRFTDKVAARVKELETLYSEGGLRRKLPLEEFTESSTSSEYRLDAGKWAPTRTQNIAKIKVWGTVLWLPTSTPPPDLKHSADLAIHGLTRDAILPALWELFPWSWLIDYFGNVGSYIQATRNSIPSLPVEICIMVQRTWTRQHDAAIFPPSLICSAGKSTVVTKERDTFPPTPGITGRIPFLNGRQLGILGSLAVLKGAVK